jgi:hypothetical protein
MAVWCKWIDTGVLEAPAARYMGSTPFTATIYGDMDEREIGRTTSFKTRCP